MTAWRLVQRGPSDRAPIVGWLLGRVLDARLTAAAPDRTIIATEGAFEALGEALEIAGPSPDPWLVGYSAGCQGVREALYQRAPRAGVVAIDGTHGPWPLRQDARELAVWREAWQEAVDGRGPPLWLTCTTQRYTERISKPFASTSRMVAEIAGWREALELPSRVVKPDARMVQPDRKTATGRAWAGVWVGSDCDGPSHVYQATHVLPWLLERALADEDGVGSGGAWIRELAEAAVRPVADALLAAWRTTTDTTPAILAAARAELDRGVREEGGHNAGDEIAKYFGAGPLAVAGRGGPMRGGKPTGWAPGWDWCAAAVGWCGLRPWRISVREIVSDAVDAGRFSDPTEEPLPGWLGIYRRNGQDPRKGGSGHVDVVEARKGDRVVCVSPNSGDRWQRIERPWSDPTRVGWIRT